MYKNCDQDHPSTLCQHQRPHYDDDDDDDDGGDDGDGDDSHLVFIMPASWFECVGSTNQHSGLLRLGDHADVVLALRLVG